MPKVVIIKKGISLLRLMEEINKSRREVATEAGVPGMCTRGQE